VDFPPDSYLHMLMYGLDLPQIQHLLVTHSHQDHFYPEDLAMRGNGFSDDVKGVLNIYGNDKVQEKLDAITDKASKAMRLDEILSFNPLKAFEPVNIGGHTVTPLPALHDRTENCFFYLIEKDGQALVYGNDTGIFPNEAFDYLAGKKLDIVSLDCTLISHKDGNNHMGLPDNKIVIDRLRELGCIHSGTKCVVTHFSHHGGMLHSELEIEAGKIGCLVAYDGMALGI